MDNAEKLATLGTQDEERQPPKKQQHVNICRTPSYANK
jgi:hypothetical protein